MSRGTTLISHLMFETSALSLNAGLRNFLLNSEILLQDEFFIVHLLIRTTHQLSYSFQQILFLFIAMPLSYVFCFELSISKRKQI